MKVLTLTSLYPNNIWPHHGVFVKERITRLARLPGISLKVVAPVPFFPNLRVNHRWRYSQVAQREIIEGVEVFHPRYFLIPKVGMPAYGYLMALSLHRLLRRLQHDFPFDIIDAHYIYPDGFAAVQLARLFDKPVVVTARGSDINLFAQFRTIRPLLSSCLKRADQVITVCKALKDAIVNLNILAAKVRVIANGVDTSKFRPIPRSEARRLLDLPHNERVVLSVGGLVEPKGFDVLIRSLRILRAKPGNPDLSLIIAGEGAARSRLQRLIDTLDLAPCVRLVGSVPHEQLFQWYSAADLFCLASSREGWPNVILESLACGTPVVASNVGGIPEIIANDHLGLLCDRDDSSFASAIGHGLSRQWDRAKLVQYAREHTWDHAARSVHDVLADVLGRRNPDAASQLDMA